MPSRKLQLWLPLIGIALIAALVLLWPNGQANAQCGSQASSCKNCHEVQGQLAVNNDGTGWHQSHAFGDFCANCHAGNVQAADKDAAHVGMVPPLSDLNANCAACHPDDLQARGEVYATILGVALDTGANPPAADQPPANPEPAQPDAANPPPAASIVVGEDVIDYAQRYDQVKSGGLNVNWGDVIVIALIVIVLIGGGAFMYWNERRRRGGVIAAMTPRAAGVAVASVDPAEYPPEVVALLPLIARLNPVGLHALKRLLETPDETSELLHSLSRLDPELVRRIRMLDRDARALLMGLAGD